jgi:hypothetical protein
MKIETYNRAKQLQESIRHFESRILQIEKLRKRDKDEDFNMLRELAHESCRFALNTLEKQFESL